MSLRDTYDVAGPLGEGGMCTVRRGWHRRLGRPVALKFLRPELAADPAERSRFLREAAVGRHLEHPGIVRVLDLGEAEEGPWLALELVEGNTLAELESQGLERHVACRLLGQVARALAHAHEQGVIHRDLKPSNILVGRDGRALVADWGIARSMTDEAGLTKTGLVLGTPDYMAPEQITGSALGPPVDTYALGVMIFEALAGHRPFRGSMTDILRGHLRASPPSLRTLAPPAPPALTGLVTRLMDKDGTRRPSAAEAAAVLEGCADSAEPAAGAPVPRSLPRRSPGRTLRPHLALVLVVALGGAAILAHRTPRPDPSVPPPRGTDLTIIDRVVAATPTSLVIRHRSREGLPMTLDLMEHRSEGDVAHPRLELNLTPVTGPHGTVGGTTVDLPTPLLDSATATLALSGSPPRSFEVRPSPVVDDLLAPLEALSADRRIDLLEGLDDLRQRFPTSREAPAYQSARDALLAGIGLDAAWMTLARGVLQPLAASSPPYAPPRARLVTALEALEAFESAMPVPAGQQPPWGVAVSPLRGVTTVAIHRAEDTPAEGWSRKFLSVDAPGVHDGHDFDFDVGIQLLPADLVRKIALSDVSSAIQTIHAVQFPGPFPEVTHELGSGSLPDRRRATRAVYEVRVVNWNPMFALEMAVDGGQRRVVANTWSRSPYRKGGFPEEPHLVRIALEPSPLRQGPVTIRLRPLSLRRSVPAIAPRVSRPRLLVALPGAPPEPWPARP